MKANRPRGPRLGGGLGGPNGIIFSLFEDILLVYLFIIAADKLLSGLQQMQPKPFEKVPDSKVSRKVTGDCARKMRSEREI